MRTLSADVTILGSGTMALWLAWILVKLGLKVSVLEVRPEIAAGTSVKNEGWLHCGTYHAAAIVDRTLAMQVAKRTILGHYMTLRYAPEARTELGTHSFALLRAESVEETTSRWTEAGVFHRPVSKRDVERLEPDLNLGEYESVFEVADVAVNSRTVYGKLVDDIRAKGGQILKSVEVVGLRDQTVTIRHSNGSEQHLETQVFVCAAGCGIRPFFTSIVGIDLPVRYFVSHLFDVPRVSRHAFFGVDPRDITAMHHGEWSVVGFTKDQVAVPSPTFDPCKEQIDHIKAALVTIAPKADLLRGTGRACTKVDVDCEAVATSTFGNLNIAYGEPLPNVFWVLPGKMTESPYAARALAEVIRPRFSGSIVEEAATHLGSGFDDLTIALRPIDTY